MKRFKYILVLTIIFTSYIFSQVEENEIIDMDTVTRVDTVIVEQEGKKDFKNYDFYNDYLANLPKTNKSDNLKTNDDKLPTINDSTKIIIISAKLGYLVFWVNASVTLDIPIDYNFNFATKCFSFGILNPGGSNKYWKGLGLGIGVVTKKTDNVIIKYNMYPSLVVSDKDHGEKVGFGMNIGMDVILWKVLSVGLDVTSIGNKSGGSSIPPFPLLTVGLNIVY